MPIPWAYGDFFQHNLKIMKIMEKIIHKILRLPIIAFSIFMVFSFTPSFGQSKFVLIGEINNKIVIGNLAGSRPLTFGFRNLLEEYLQENDFEIVEDETKFDYKINIDLLFFDVETTKSSVAVFHKNNAETVLKIKAYLLDSKGKKIKECLITEKASEISVSTLIVDEGGKMNQQSVSTVIKKVCGTAIKQLLN